MIMNINLDDKNRFPKLYQLFPIISQSSITCNDSYAVLSAYLNDIHGSSLQSLFKKF